MDNNTTVEKKISPFNFELIQALKNSELLKPVYVDVRNESYWYHSRKRLGSKQHSRHIVVQNKSTQKWESYFYKMDIRKSDYELVPQKVMLKQDHDSRVDALKHIEAMAKERDLCPGENKKLVAKVNPDKLLNTHFRILVVSSKFERLDNNQRAALIYSELVAAIGVTPVPFMKLNEDSAKHPGGIEPSAGVISPSGNAGSPQSPATERKTLGVDSAVEDGSGARPIASEPYVPTYVHGDKPPNIQVTPKTQARKRKLDEGSASYFEYFARCPPSRVKLGTTFGENMCNLPLFRYLLPTAEQIPFELLFDARTPSQWKPDLYPPPLSERFGSNHADKKASRLPVPAQKKAQMKRVKNLTTASVSERDRVMHNIQDKLGKPEESKSRPDTSELSRSSITANYGNHGDTLADALGVDPFVSGVKFKKTGGVFGHHFHDMKPGVKEKVLETSVLGKRQIKSEGYHPGATAQDDGAGFASPRTGRLSPGRNTGRRMFPDINQKNTFGSPGGDTVDGQDGLGTLGSHLSSSLVPHSAALTAEDILKNMAALSPMPSGSVNTGRDSGQDTNTGRTSIRSNFPATGRRGKKKMSAYAQSAEYDKGTATEAEMLTELHFRSRAVEKSAIRLQRIWRIRTFHRCIRWHWRQEFARLTIQRVVRGHQTRTYYNLLKKIAPLACIRIQRSYRAYTGNKILLRWRAAVYRMTRRVLPWIKLFLKNCYMSWTRKHEHQATVIQSCVRMHLCRTRYYRSLGEKYLSMYLYYCAATDIQRVLRGKWGRRRFEVVKGEVLRVKIDQPCCLRLQRVYRGWVGRNLARQRRYEVRATLKLQRNIKAFVWRVWKKQMVYAGMKISGALAVQRIVRGHFDRDLYRRKRAAHWYATVYIPSVLKSQAACRMHQARKAYVIKKIQWAAASVIQRVYRQLVEKAARRARFRELIVLKRMRMAIVMGKYIRRWLAMKSYKRVLFERAGKRILAGKVILRAWRHFIYGKRLQILLDENRLKILTAKSVKMTESRRDIMLDVEEIRGDIAATKKNIERFKERLHIVNTFCIESGLRIPQLQMSLATISAEDMEKGWAEAYGQEYESLNHMCAMATEERRLLKSMIMKKHNELLMLQCELEDTELEADHIAVLELANFEGLRRSEVGRIERRLIDKRNRALRVERCKWKIDSIRRNVIARKRSNLVRLVKEVCIVAFVCVYAMLPIVFNALCFFLVVLLCSLNKIGAVHLPSLWHLRCVSSSVTVRRSVWRLSRSRRVIF